jgi:phage gpG-like protein
MRFTVRVTGADDVSRTLELTADNIQDMRPAMKNVGAYLEGITHQAFKDQENPATHRSWKRLADATIAARRNRNPGGKIRILRDTGTLFQSIHYRPKARSVSVGTKLEYGRKHQLGIGVPVRKFLGIDAAGTDEVVSIIERWIMRRARGRS